MEYESQEHYEAEMGYAGQAEAEAIAQGWQAEQFKYVCMECKHGFEGSCSDCDLLNEQVKNV